MRLMGAIKAKQLSDELWTLTVEGIEEGELDCPTSIEKAFKAGVMSAIALIHCQIEQEQDVKEKAALN